MTVQSSAAATDLYDEERAVLEAARSQTVGQDQTREGHTERATRDHEPG